MDIMGIDIGHIAELGTNIAQSGAIRAVQITSDEIFEYIIAIAVLIYETDPG